MQLNSSTITNNSLIAHEFTSRNEFLTHISENKDKILLFKFTADWCKPCKQIKDDVNIHQSLSESLKVTEEELIKEREIIKKYLP